MLMFTFMRKIGIILFVPLCFSLVFISRAGVRPYSYPMYKDLSPHSTAFIKFQKPDMPIRVESKDDFNVGDILMVHDRFQRLFIQKDGKFKRVGYLARLDRVEVLDKSEKYVKVRIETTSNPPMRKFKDTYVYHKGLSTYEDFRDFDADVYVIQNVATEKLRVYYRLCKDYSCPPKLLLEASMVAGGEEKKTVLGNFRIFQWKKFYQYRVNGQYPSWYDPSYPEQPGPNAGWSSWFDSEVMPWRNCDYSGKNCTYEGMVRGAYGWYTALVEPNRNVNQWTHGTIGWGEGSADMIERARGQSFLGAFISIFKSLRSSGCTRVDNRTIAFLRHILPIGTPIIKIYALEELQDEESRNKYYSKMEEHSWQYALTADGVRKADEEATSADYYVVRRKGLYRNGILEQGVYSFASYPRPVQYDVDYESDYERAFCSSVEYGGEGDYYDYNEDGTFASKNVVSSLPKECDLYGIGGNSFRGVFYVDTGLLKGYKHPLSTSRWVKLKRGGFRSQYLPKFVRSENYR